MKKIIIFLFISVMVFSSETKKFFFTFGLGHHQSFLTFEEPINSIDTFPEAGYSTRFKLGYYLSNQHSIALLREAMWFNGPYLNQNKNQHPLFIAGFTGLSYSYYLEEELPSLFFTSAIGLGDLSRFKDESIDTGYSTMIGFGYEFEEKFSLEFNLIRGKNNGTRLNHSGVKTVSGQISINYSIY